MLIKLFRMLVIITIFHFAINPMNLKAGEKIKDHELSVAEKTAENILKEIEKGTNLQVFNKKFIISESDNYLIIKEKNSKNQQVLFDALLSRLSKSKDERQLIGGGFLAIQLNTKTGKKKNNESKLVDYLLELLNSNKKNCQIFSIKVLSSEYFKDPSVFSSSSRKSIYQKIKNDPSIIDLLGSDIVHADNNILMAVAKMGRTSEAVQLLKNIQKKDTAKKLICSAVLAKMNISEEQATLVNNFNSTTYLQNKYDLAYALSLWGGKVAQVALANALRTPGYVEFKGNRPPEMIRLHIAIALVRTINYNKDELPSRGAFSWKEEDFIKIENWAVKNLGTRWNAPIPKYKAVEKVPF